MNTKLIMLFAAVSQWRYTIVPRATVDIDLLIPSGSLDEVRAIATALGYTIRGMEMTFSNGAIEIRRVSKIDSETGHALSLAFLLATPEIKQAWDSRVQADWEGGKLSVVSREGLIWLKKMRSSAQDHADIIALMEDVDERQIDMSAKAITARLKLVSQLRRLCLSLGTAKIKTRPLVETPAVKNHEQVPNDPEYQRR